MHITISLCTDMMSLAIHMGIYLKSAKIKRSLCIAFIDSWIKPPKNNSGLNFLGSELCLILDKLWKARMFLPIGPKPAYLWFLEIILNSCKKWFRIQLIFILPGLACITEPVTILPFIAFLFTCYPTSNSNYAGFTGKFLKHLISLTLWEWISVKSFWIIYCKITNTICILRLICLLL